MAANAVCITAKVTSSLIKNAARTTGDFEFHALSDPAEYDQKSQKGQMFGAAIFGSLSHYDYSELTFPF